MKKVIIGVVLICLSAAQWAEGVYIDFSGTPGAQPVSMAFAQDVNFTITKTTNTMVVAFVIDNLFATPDIQQDLIDSFSSILEFSINGGAHLQIQSWSDNLTFDYGAMTPNDSYFFLYSAEGINLVAGDVITLHAGTLGSLKPPTADFNLGSDGDYNMFIVGYDTTNITAAVPEPASVMLIGLGGVLISGYRRFYGRR